MIIKRGRIGKIVFLLLLVILIFSLMVAALPPPPPPTPGGFGSSGGGSNNNAESIVNVGGTANTQSTTNTQSTSYNNLPSEPATPSSSAISTKTAQSSYSGTLEERVAELESKSGFSVFTLFLIVFNLVLLGLVIYFLVVDWPKRKMILAQEQNLQANAFNTSNAPKQVFNTPAVSASNQPNIQQGIQSKQSYLQHSQQQLPQQQQYSQQRFSRQQQFKQQFQQNIPSVQDLPLDPTQPFQDLPPTPPN
ncbi:MAG: hypothetical protein ABIG89_06975 [Candidatus Woesearchaeota archaeon]